jgi:hypothetical protein
MTTEQIVVLAILEAVALVVIVRLWWRGGKSSLLARLLWTVVLTVPRLGILVYAFLRSNPGEHPDNCYDFGGGGDSHSDSSH